jgi:hypothetical protein
MNAQDDMVEMGKRKLKAFVEREERLVSGRIQSPRKD